MNDGANNASREASRNALCHVPQSRDAGLVASHHAIQTPLLAGGQRRAYKEQLERATRQEPIFPLDHYHLKHRNHFSYVNSKAICMLPDLIVIGYALRTQTPHFRRNGTQSEFLIANQIILYAKY